MLDVERVHRHAKRLKTRAREQDNAEVGRLISMVDWFRQIRALADDAIAMAAEIKELRGLCSETLAWLMLHEEADDLFDRICLAIFGLSEKEKTNDARP